MVGFLAALAATALGQARLTTVKHSQAGNGLRIVIEGRGLTKPEVTQNASGTAWNVSFDGTLAGRAGKATIGRFGVKDIKWGVFTKTPPKVHVHISKVASCNPQLAQKDGLWTIVVARENPKANPVIPVKIESGDDLAAMASAIQQLGSAPSATQAPAAPATPVLPPPFEASAQQIAAPPIEIVAKAAPAMGERLVSLEFSNTDVVQILRALSLQAGVNVIASPEVSPADKPVRLSMALNSVTVEDALSFLTAMTGTRYGRIANTYVVTPAANFSASMRSIMERSSSGFQTRVVNISSGAGNEIKSATLAAKPQDGVGGYYDVIVPGEQAPSAAEGTAQPAGNSPDAQADGKQQASPAGEPAAAAPKRARSYYVMLVGDPDRLDDVEGYVRMLDSRIAASYSLSRTQDLGTAVVPVLSGQTQRIQAMLNKLLSDHPRASEYSISESAVKELAEGETATKVLLMIGPAAELGTLERFARDLDKELCLAAGITYSADFAEQEKQYEVVELRFLEPVIAEQDLKSRIKGLWVTVLPDPVTPGIKGEDESEKQEAPTDSGQGAGGQGGSQKQQTSKLKREIGREPLRLMLHGTRQQINEAKSYLRMVDVAPRQVGLELRVMELTKEDALKLGLDWSILSSGGIVRFRSNQSVGGTSATPGTVGGTITTQGRDSASVLASLDKVAGDRKLIARPNALISDGRVARLFVGDTVRYIKSINTSQNGTTVITDEIEVGAVFNIRARIGDQGNFALDVEQNFSILTGFLPVPGGGQLPQTSDRRTNMFVNMVSGETVALGGLISETDRKSVSGIPLLMDLPLIGQLFKRTENNRVRTEIVFFLTAVDVTAANRPDAAAPKGGTLGLEGLNKSGN